MRRIPMIRSKRTFLVPVLIAAVAMGALWWTPPLSSQVQASQELSTSAAAPAGQKDADQEKGTAEGQQDRMFTKTYDLKFIRVPELMQSARFYVQDYSGTESTLTVRIFGRNIPEFEALLKKLDVEKANIQFQVFTIIASKETPGEQIKKNFVAETQGIPDKDLRRVLDEMKGLWNFKYYQVESPSFLVVKDGAGRSKFKLVSDSYDFDMNVLHVNLRGDKPGSRIISVGQIQLNQSFFTADNKVESTLIDTSDVTFKENGYLVVGVSGFTAGWRGLALILVIRAEIK
jgi:hypothetical protein